MEEIISLACRRKQHTTHIQGSEIVYLDCFLRDKLLINTQLLDVQGSKIVSINITKGKGDQLQHGDSRSLEKETYQGLANFINGS